MPSRNNKIIRSIVGEVLLPFCIARKARRTRQYSSFTALVFGTLFALLCGREAAADPIMIDTLADLENINTNLSGDYVLGANINASGSLFAPIGTTSNPFTGEFNGNGFTISNLAISAPQSGLFAEVGSSGVVNDVALSNANVSGSTGGGFFGASGGIAYANFGTISNSSVTGSVGGTDAGGIASVNYGAIVSSQSSAFVSGFVNGVGGLVGNNEGTIFQSSANGQIHSGGPGFAASGLGGLVGTNSGTISQSFSTAAVADLGQGDSTGGLVGTNSGTINQSYATGPVTGYFVVGGGGLVGRNLGAISESYSTGSVVGNTSTSIQPIQGGLIGSNTPPNIVGTIVPPGSATNSYWDTQASGQSTSAGGTGLTTVQLQSGTLPTGFSPIVWNAAPGQYPQLLWQAASGTTPVVFSALPTSENISVPLSALPSPNNILGGVLSFQSQYGGLLPAATQAYLNTAIAATTPMLASGNLKQMAGQSATNLTRVTTLLDIGSFVGEPDVGGAVSLAVDFGLPANVGPLPANSSATAQLSSGLFIFSNLALTAASCGGAAATLGVAVPADVLCGVSVVGSLLTDVVIPEEQIFAASDPPDSNYTSVFMLPTSVPAIAVRTGRVAFDNTATSLTGSLQQASLYLLALNTSINRYSSAIAAGDVNSAVLQLQAILHYLALYNSALQTASNALKALLSLPELQLILQATYNSSAFVEFQSQLATFGFSADQLDFFNMLGLDSNAVLQSFLDLMPPLSSDTIGQDLGQIASDLPLSGSLPSSVPEPSSGIMLLSALFIGLVIRQRSTKQRIISVRA